MKRIAEAEVREAPEAAQVPGRFRDALPSGEGEGVDDVENEPSAD